MLSKHPDALRDYQTSHWHLIGGNKHQAVLNTGEKKNTGKAFKESSNNMIFLDKKKKKDLEEGGWVFKADVFAVGSSLGFPQTSKTDGEEERLQTEAAAREEAAGKYFTISGIYTQMLESHWNT